MNRIEHIAPQPSTRTGRPAMLGDMFTGRGGRVSSPGPARVTLLTAGLVLLALLAFAPSAFAGKVVINSIGQQNPGTQGGQFGAGGPAGMAINYTGNGGVPAGTFYVADQSNARIQRFSPTADFVSTWGLGVKDGEEEFEVCTEAESCTAGNPGPQAGQMNHPAGVVVDQATGNIYVTDQQNLRVDVFSAKGIFEGAFGWSVNATNPESKLQFCSFVSGCRAGSVGTAGGQLGAGIGFGRPGVDPSGNVYVPDGKNRRVEVFTPTLSSGLVTGVSFAYAFGKDVAGTGDPGNSGTGFEVCTTVCKRGAIGTEAGAFKENSPFEVSVDSSGNIYTSEGSRIQKFSSVPAPLDEHFGQAALESASLATDSLAAIRIAVDPETGDLFAASQQTGGEQLDRILELDPAGNAVELHGTDLNIGQKKGIAVAPASIGGNLYLAAATSIDESQSAAFPIGNGILVLNETEPTIDPAVCTDHTAQLSGEVVSNGVDVEYHFEYSTDGGKWTPVSEADIDAGTGPGKLPANQTAEGLTGSQHYLFRLVANRPLGGGRAISGTVECTTESAPPVISAPSASAVTATAATLGATLNPQNEATTYHFEYLTQAEFEANGSSFSGPDPAARTPESSAGSGGATTQFGADVAGLQPGTVYRFHMVATNPSGTTLGPEGTFETYPQSGEGLPDNRAYELVSPPDTNADPVLAIGLGEGFGINPVTPNGKSVVFGASSVAGSTTSGTGNNDAYEAVRAADDWNPSLVSPTTVQAERLIHHEGVSSDHLYSVFRVEGGVSRGGELETAFAGSNNNYIRKPNGSYELVGIGSEGIDPDASARYVSAGAGHIIFTNEATQDPKKPLEPNAPPEGTTTIYDRSIGGPTHVVSLLPGGAPAGNSQYLEASADGSAVVFSAGATLYERRNNAETVEVATGNPSFAGVSSDGNRVFYASSGVLVYACDTAHGSCAGSGATNTPIEVVAGAYLSNVSADGSHAYFVSPLVLTGSERNENGEEATSGQFNFYAWDGSSTKFIGILTFEDINPTKPVSLLNWLGKAVGEELDMGFGPANDPSRTTPDGSALVFESRANLTSYDSGGHIEIYRYEMVSGRLACVSCNPTGAPARSDARLEKFNTLDSASPIDTGVRIANVTEDGEEVFFQTGDVLAPNDTDGVDDVYEWEANGHGTCTSQGGCVSLISSGRSPLPNYLFGMTPDGSDVLFATNDQLLRADKTDMLSVYDARVGGGFPEEAEGGAACRGDACQGSGAAVRGLPSPASTNATGGNVSPQRDCSVLGRRISKLSHRARALRQRSGVLERRAQHTVNPSLAHRLRRRGRRIAVAAQRRARLAKRLAGRAKRCRRTDRGVSR